MVILEWQLETPHRGLKHQTEGLWLVSNGQGHVWSDFRRMGGIKPEALFTAHRWHTRAQPGSSQTLVILISASQWTERKTEAERDSVKPGTHERCGPKACVPKWCHVRRRERSPEAPLMACTYCTLILGFHLGDGPMLDCPTVVVGGLSANQSIKNKLVCSQYNDSGTVRQ